MEDWYGVMNLGSKFFFAYATECHYVIMYTVNSLNLSFTVPLHEIEMLVFYKALQFILV